MRSETIRKGQFPNVRRSRAGLELKRRRGEKISSQERENRPTSQRERIPYPDIGMEVY